MLAIVGAAPLRAQVSMSPAPLLEHLDTPVFMTSWPDNPDVLVVAQRGTALITRHNLTAPPTGMGGAGVAPVALVLDLSEKAFIPTLPNLQFIGLTSFGFHPEFNSDPRKRYLYVRYNEDNRADTPPNTRMVIERYFIPTGSLSADPTSATLVYENDEITMTAHAGGQIHFDTADDGDEITKLFFAIPDNQFSTDPCCELVVAQDDFNALVPGTHFGKLLWVDVELVKEAEPPPTPQVMAKGLRNPHAFSVDPGDGAGQGRGDVWVSNTGRLMTGDVFRWIAGSGVLNFGWPWKEGDGNAFVNDPHKLINTVCNDGIQDQCPDPGGNTFTDPVYVARHALTNNNHDALLGGFAYRGDGALKNMFVFGTFGVAGAQHPRVFAFDPNNLPQSPTVDLSIQLGLDAWPTFTLHGLGQDSAGELYLIRVDSPNNEVLDNGTIFKILQ